DFLITQLFFGNRSYFQFAGRARAAGIEVPILPGIMPITNVDQIERFTAMCGAHLPSGLSAALRARRDDPDAALQLGVAYAALQLVRIFRSLDTLVGGDREKARLWLRAPNRHLGAPPVRLLAGTQGLVHVAEYLDAVRGTL